MLIIDLLSLNTESAKYVALGHLHQVKNDIGQVMILAVTDNKKRIDSEIGCKSWNVIYLPNVFGNLILRVLTVYFCIILAIVTRKKYRVLNFSGLFFPFLPRQKSLAQNPFPLLIDELDLKVSFAARVKNLLIRMLISSVRPTGNRRMIFNSKHLRSIYNDKTRFSFDESILYQGVDSSLIAEDRLAWDDKDSFLLLSTVTRHKRTLEALKLISELIERCAMPQGVTVNIVGKIDDVQYKAEIDDWIHQEQLGFVIKWHGFVSMDVKNVFLSQAKYYVSLSKCESFGIPLLEAQSAGVIPIIAKGTAQEEIAGDGAIIFDDSNRNLELILEILQDKDRCSQIINLATENAKRFDWSKIYRDVQSPLI